MTRDESIVEFDAWLRTAPGRYLMAWEQDRMDHAVADTFGYHAVQLGLPEIEGLRANRMPHRWVASDSLALPDLGPDAPEVLLARPMDARITTLSSPAPMALHCEYDALPFPNACLDLVVLPHTLELARDPHQTLREVERVLVPEGRVVISGFNPASLWGLRHRLARQANRGQYLPSAGELLGYWRLRDWLRLLGFEVEVGRFGCWRPAVKSPLWLDRYAWMDGLGDRWWPVLGAVYFLVAVKRVRGMHLVGRVRTERRKAKVSAVAVSQRNHSLAPRSDRDGA